MSDGDATNCLARMSSFASALAVVTKQLIGMSARLNSLSMPAGAAAFQIQRLSISATHLSPPSQAVVTCCQGKSESPTNLANSLKWLNGSVKLFFLAGLAIQATKLWVEAVRWIWSIIGPRFTSPLAAIAEIVRSIWRAVAASEIFDTIAEGAAALVAALTAPGWATFAVIVAAVAGALYLLRRNFTAVVRAIRKLSSVVADEAREFVDKVGSAIGEVVGMNPELMPHRTNGRGTATDAAASRYSSASRNMVAASLIPPVLSVATLVRPELVGLSGANTTTALRAAAAAIIAVPLLLTPAGADVTSVQPRVDTTKTTSVVINSSPTITINASDCGDVEQRVLEILRKHRQELYAQWCNELQRRQRTEF